MRLPGSPLPLPPSGLIFSPFFRPSLCKEKISRPPFRCCPRKLPLKVSLFHCQFWEFFFHSQRDDYHWGPLSFCPIVFYAILMYLFFSTPPSPLTASLSYAPARDHFSRDLRPPLVLNWCNVSLFSLTEIIFFFLLPALPLCLAFAPSADSFRARKRRFTTKIHSNIFFTHILPGSSCTGCFFFFYILGFRSRKSVPCILFTSSLTHHPSLHLL